MSRLYDIIRQMEENSQTVNVSQQELTLLDSKKPEVTKSFWKAYRGLVLTLAFTLSAAILATLGHHLLRHDSKKEFAVNIPAGDSKLVALEKKDSTVINSAPEPSLSSKEPADQNRVNQTVSTVEAVIESNEIPKKSTPDEKTSSNITRNTKTGSSSASSGKKLTRSETVLKKEKKTVAKKEKANEKSKSDDVAKKERVPINQPVLPPQSGIITMAEEARKNGNTDEAIRLYKQYMVFHRNPFVMNNLGALLISKGQLQEAEQLLYEAFQITPDEDIAINLAGVRVMLGKSTQACDVIKKVKEARHDSSPKLKDFEAICK